MIEIHNIRPLFLNAIRNNIQLRKYQITHLRKKNAEKKSRNYCFC